MKDPADLVGRGRERVFFGKYKGSKWRDVPEDYLYWMAQHESAYLQFHGERELQRRKLKLYHPQLLRDLKNAVDMERSLEGRYVEVMSQDED